MVKAFGRVLVSMSLAGFVAAAPADGGTSRCTGDCNGDKAVRIAELVTMVNIALNRAALRTCPNGDTNGNGEIVIGELIRAVGNALGGCRDDIEPRPFKLRIEHPSDPYLAFPGIDGAPSWVKFTIRVDEPDVVYFQNSSQTPFHHDFVAATLEPYIGWTPAEIDAVSLHAEGQELVFGAVLYSPLGPHEIAIQLVRQDAYSAEDVILYFEAVRASIDKATSVPVFYFPTFEQQGSAEAQRAVLEVAGIRIDSTARWSAGNVCYTEAWAHGRLVFVPGDEIDDAYADGTLRPTDILLTDGVPAEIPFVAGVLSLVPSTPSSHVAILAADWDVPFAFLARADSAAAAQDLVGRDVIVRATTLSPRFFSGRDFTGEACQVRIADVTDELSEEVVAELRQRKRPPDLDIRPFRLSGTYSAEVATATPDDIDRIGGKAANYGFLLRAIPANTRIAMAFTFDLWNDYLDQPIEGGSTLRTRIDELLAPFRTYPPSDFDALFDALDDARDLIDDVADFTPAQRTTIAAALQRFAADERIRFRSSTNVEDGELFTGAGLYDSESGCLADDLDGDDDGPSICDAERDEERGVFRALRKVFQSFYNDNAYLERLRHGVDESEVAMGVLVNKTFVDQTELANGVATLVESGFGSRFVTLVTQPGAFSVTNPEDGGLPEVVEVFHFGGGSVFPNLVQATNRLPLGSTVMTMPQEYVALTELLLDVGAAFGAYHGESQFTIEFEYKKITGEGLVVKQVRRIPGLAPAAGPPILIDAQTELCSFQGEYEDVFANYRLKSRWQPVFASGVVGEGAALFESADHQHVAAGAVAQLTGAPASWPDAAHASFDPGVDGVVGIADSWSAGGAGDRRTMRLRTMVPVDIGPRRLPIVFPDDLGFTLFAEYENGVPYLDFNNTPQTRTEDVVLLLECADQIELTPRHLLQERSFVDGDANIAIEFYWPPFPTGAVAGYTAPLDRWVGTTISGVTPTAVQLSGYFSQTYRPEHHNFTENFLFDPHLEEGSSAGVLAEWDAAGIRALIQPAGFSDPEMLVLTTDGRIEPLSAITSSP